MTRKIILASAALLSLGITGAAHAQNGTVTGTAGGAVTGAIVGGPVGAVVGGAVGAVAGTAIDPPPERVVTYVQQAPMPAEPVVVEQEVVVGKPLPQTVVLQQIPDDPTYAYAVVNERRVIVNPQNYTVVRVLD
ncbi:DUF1236 domain-containing protein [Rhizobium sp. YIM 134829]|uniref:DUF1236 domain-containing protein n=1 Tax=Rhizobium sp. YIM 134829 TaxID=3390453 RepID=UPI00397B50C1